MKTLLHPMQTRSPTGSRLLSMQLLRRLYPLILALVLMVSFVPHPLRLEHTEAERIDIAAIDSQSVRLTAAAACYGVYHIVKPGQTLHSIAALYGTTAYRIAVCNRLSAYTVYVGQSLLVPIRRPVRSRYIGDNRWDG